MTKPKVEGKLPQFPDDWGADCPPADATDAGGTYYRRVLHAPPTAEDFRSIVEMRSRRVSAALMCQARGLSVFTVLEDALDYAERYPDSGNLIAKAVLDGTDGRTKPTPSQGNSHTTWWPYENVARHAKFSVLS